MAPGRLAGAFGDPAGLFGAPYWLDLAKEAERATSTWSPWKTASLSNPSGTGNRTAGSTVCEDV